MVLEQAGVRRRGPRARAAPLVNGVRFDPIPASELPARISAFLDEGGSHVVHFLAAHPTVVARGDDAYRALLNRGDLNLPDGLPVAWALRLLGHAAEQVTGTHAFGLLCGWGRGRGLSHFLYGGAPDVVDELRVRLAREYPGIAIAGAVSPPFRPLSHDELARDAERIRESGADFVWVGLGAPKQDHVGERLRELEAAPVILCVGAAFDFLAGRKRRAPSWMQRAGLEWLFRLVTEPRRLWRRYLLGNPQFVLGVARDVVGRKVGP